MFSRINVNNIPLGDALIALLKPMGLDYRVLPEFIWVSTPDVLRRESFEPVEARLTVPSGTDKERETSLAILEAKKKTLQKPIGIDFLPGTDIRSVTDWMSNFYDVNVVLDERVMLRRDGTTSRPVDGIEHSIDSRTSTINVKSMPMGDALIAVLKPMGLDYRVLPEFIWVSTPAVLRTESFASVASRLALALTEGELTDSLKDKLDRRLVELSRVASVDFDAGTDLRDLLDSISDYYQVNIVLDERVMLSSDDTATARAGEVEPTIARECPRVNLTRLPVGDALVALLKPMGLDYRILPEYVWISTSDVLRRETKAVKSVSPGTEQARRDALGDIRVPVGVDPAAIRPSEISGTQEKDQEGRLALGDDDPVLRQIEELKKKLAVQGNWNLDKGTDIRQILESASDSYDVNIVLDERVMLSADTDVPTRRGAVEATGKNKLQEAVHLTDVPLREALTTVLSQLGLDYKVQPEFVWVSTPYVLRYETYEELETRYFMAADAEVAADLLARLRDRAPPVVKDLNTGETLSYADFSPTTNLFIFHNTPSNFEIIERILSGLEPGAPETTSTTVDDQPEEKDVPLGEPAAVAEPDESDPQRFRDAGIKLYGEGNYAEAFENLEHALLADPNDEIAMKYGRDCALHLAGGVPPDEETKAILSKMRENEAKLQDTKVSVEYPPGTDIGKVLAFFEKRVGVKIVLDERVMLPPSALEAGAPDAAPAVKEGAKAVEAADRRARQLLVHRPAMFADVQTEYFDATRSREPIVGSGYAFAPVRSREPIVPTVARETSRIVLKNVSLKVALKAVLARMGLEHRVQPDFVWVSTHYVVRHETYEPLETRYYVLQATAANEIVSQLRLFLPDVVEPETGRVLSYVRTSPVPDLLIVRHVPSAFGPIEEVIESHVRRKRR